MYYQDNEAQEDLPKYTSPTPPSSRPITPACIEKTPYLTEHTNVQIATEIESEQQQPMSPAEDPLQKTFYPPESAIPDMYPESTEVRFIYKGKHYGRF